MHYPNLITRVTYPGLVTFTLEISPFPTFTQVKITSNCGAQILGGRMEIGNYFSASPFS